MLQSFCASLAPLFYSASAQAQSGPSAGPSQLLQFVPIVFAFVVMIIYTNYANKKKAAERDAALGKLERGNEVLTTSGILGRIEGLTDLYITLEIAPNTRIRVLRSSIAGPAKDLAQTTTEVKT